MQSEACVAQEGQMRARIAEAKGRTRVDQQLADFVLVDIEQLAVERGLHSAFERVIEQPVEGILARRAGKVRDRAADERSELRVRRVVHMQVFEGGIGKA